MLPTSNAEASKITFDPPTDLTLSSNEIEENAGAGAVVGSFSAVDPEGGTAFAYALTAVLGPNDNAAFQIQDNSLLTNADFNFEETNSYTVEVSVTDAQSEVSREVFTIAVLDVNDPPTDIELDGTTISEDAAVGTVVGRLSTVDDEGGAFMYTLVAGEGGTNNGQFEIIDNELRSAEEFDISEDETRSVRIQTTDAGGETFAEAFIIAVTNEDEPNQAPTDVTLSANTIAESASVGTPVGTLTTTDPDAADTEFTYALVNGEGSTDNDQFSVVDDELRSNATFDIEADETRSIRIQTTDAGGAVFAKAFVITITNEEEPNLPPTGITLSSNIIAEDAEVGTAVGTLSTTDPDAADTEFAYELVPGAGSNDNEQFAIDGTTLQTGVNFSAEAGATLQVRLQTTDPEGLTYQEAFTIAVTNANNPNQAPTDITLSANTIAEDANVGTPVGTLTTTDPDAADTEFTYALVNGEGSTDNDQFVINGNELRSATPFSIEENETRSIRIQTTDAGGAQFAKAFTITITNVAEENQPPTDITLDNNAIPEEQPELTLVGRFSTVDGDNTEGFTYQKVPGAGSADNALFRIRGDSLLSEVVFDFESQSTRQVRVQTTDAAGNTFEKSFTISIDDIDESANQPPTALRLDDNTIAENEPEGSLVGRLLTTDLDDNNGFVYTLTAGEGDADNASFRIRENQLLTQTPFDFETKAQYLVRVTTTDDEGASFSRALTIEVTDVDEDTNQAPTDLLLDNSTIAENEPFNTEIGRFTVEDPDAGDQHVVLLVDGEGDDDNGRFQVRDNVLYSLVSFDFEDRDTYSIRVQGRDPRQATVTDVFTITIVDVADNQNQAPTEIRLSNTEVDEGQLVNLVVGTFSAPDPDADDTHTFSLVAGEGDDDNATFSVANDQLQTAQIFNADTQARYRIRVRADDGRGGTVEDSFTITVAEGEDPVTSLDDEPAARWLVYPVPANRHLTVQASAGPLIQFRLITPQGRVVYRSRFEAHSSPEYVLTIPEEVGGGSYVLEIRTQERVSRQRVLLR